MAQEVMELSVDTGAILVLIRDENQNEIGKIEIIPTDSDIIKRYEAVAEFFEKIDIPEDIGEEKYAELADGIKEQFDFLFNYGVSENVFSKCGPLTIISNGDFFFEDVVIKLADIIEKVTDRRIEKKMAKIKKATAKYHK